MFMILALYAINDILTQRDERLHCAVLLRIAKIASSDSYLGAYCLRHSLSGFFIGCFGLLEESEEPHVIGLAVLTTLYPIAYLRHYETTLRFFHDSTFDRGVMITIVQWLGYPIRWRAMDYG